MTDSNATELLREAEREIVILRDKLRVANGTGAKTCVKCGTFLSDELLCTECAIAAWNTRAELGSGKLTAEQVRETYEKHWHDLPTEYGIPEATALPEYSYDWQAIADELNATLGGECEMKESPFMPAWRCSECGKVNGGIFGDEQHEPPKICPSCGKAVKR